MSDVTDEVCEIGELADSKLTNLPECKTTYDAACEEGTKLWLYGEELYCHAMAHAKVLVVDDVDETDEVRNSPMRNTKCCEPSVVSPRRSQTRTARTSDANDEPDGLLTSEEASGDVPGKPKAPYAKSVVEGELCGSTGLCDAGTTREWYTSNLVVTALPTCEVMVKR